VSEEPLQQPDARRWVVAVTVLFGTFMAVMDVTVVNVALPHMMGSFGVDRSTITWVATGYAIAQILMLSMAGWWSTLLGRKRLYLVSFAVFTFGSILAGTAHSFGEMILYRTIQGLGGGALIPVSLAILRENFPARQQGMAMAIYGMGVVLAPAIGPVLGGWLIDHYGWPWIFYINVPISVVGMLMIATFLEDPPYLRRGLTSTDWAGIALLAVGLTVMQIVLERGNQENWFESRWIVAGTAVTVLALTALVFRELRAKDPVINIRLLRNVPLVAGSAIGLVFGVALFGTTFILPQFTQTLLGYPAFTSGIVLMPRALAVFAVMPLAGLLYRYIDGRLLITGGIVLLCIAYWQLGHLTLYVAPGNLVPVLMLAGAGMPFIFVTLTAVSLSGIPQSDVTDASSIYTLARTVGGNIGYAVMATLVANGTQAHRALLVQHISPYNPTYLAYQAAAAGGLARHGLDMAAAPQTAHAFFDALVNRQAAMLAYNDASLFMGLLFVIILPMVLLLPRSRGGEHAGGPSLSDG
jgi:DHA2 family multidrug resistance protein